MTRFILRDEKTKEEIFRGSAKSLEELLIEKNYFRWVVKLRGKRYAILRSTFYADHDSLPKELNITGLAREIGKEALGYTNNR